MQAPGVPIGPGRGEYGLGWKAAPLGGVPVLQHYGDNYYYHGLVFIDPATRRGAVLLMNGNGALAASTAYREIEAGVARLLADRDPAPASPLSLPRLYLLVDAALAALLALALLPLLRLRRWAARLGRRRLAGRPYRLRTAVRLAWECALPLALLGGVRLFLGANLGAQSWAEILAAFPDFTLWLWALALIVLLTAATRLALTVSGLAEAPPGGGDLSGVETG
jgi:hypothetical protein